MQKVTTALDRWADRWLSEADGAYRENIHGSPLRQLRQLLAENRRIWLAHMASQSAERLEGDATCSEAE